MDGPILGVTDMDDLGSFTAFATEVGGLTIRQAEAIYWKDRFWRIREGHETTRTRSRRVLPRRRREARPAGVTSLLAIGRALPPLASTCQPHDNDEARLCATGLRPQK